MVRAFRVGGKPPEPGPEATSEFEAAILTSVPEANIAADMHFATNQAAQDALGRRFLFH